MFAIPLQVIDGFLLKVNLGDALFIGFILGIFAVMTQGSRKLLTLHFITFGALLLLSPGSLYEPAELSIFGSILTYKMIGLGLLVASPVLYTTAQK